MSIEKLLLNESQDHRNNDIRSVNDLASQRNRHCVTVNKLLI